VEPKVQSGAEVPKEVELFAGVVGVGEGEDFVDNRDSGAHIIIARRQRRHYVHAVEMGEWPQTLALA
jgi:hypothetical protein